MSSRSVKKTGNDSEYSKREDVYYTLPWRSCLNHVVDCAVTGLRNQPLAEVVKARLNLMVNFDVGMQMQQICSGCKNNQACSDVALIYESKKELRSRCTQMTKQNKETK